MRTITDNLKFKIFMFLVSLNFLFFYSLFMPMKIWAENEKQLRQAQEQKLDQEIADFKRKLIKLEVDNENKNSKKLDKEKQKTQKLKDENLGLKKKILLIEEARNNDMASLYQELGTAYTLAKLFGQAIDAYTKALSLNPNNAEVNYNLGLLYQHSRGDAKKALHHFKKYLRLEPEAKNKEEVEYLIEMLEGTPVAEIK